ncbi:hypothetical protein Suden_1583 [Sulfurimonas denitrificans DSM 1251]|uniref:DUF255 domain-containing protein n=1 Tax=Sulfurimonas denitrificans (strain ATCC 33889 / DSM 1251) TaxID=326298 RepID=Q30Q71_SULDN|nr:thioredoxin family protein [Sulfurimonas denitrificans]ABB44860.1 hypothetical protein Suden_1583 [Sulfurimonas denitrificans DSM 1251]MDD3443291.1 thioredoxin family protein [Sulfurimonas denitrificans]
MRLSFILMIFASLLFGEHIRWQSDFEKTLIEAKKEQKDILLLVLKRDCKDCKNIFRDIFTDKEVTKRVNDKYISIVVFFEAKDSYPVELFYTQQFPALFFVSRKDELFLNAPLFGAFTKESLLNSL